MRNFLIIVLAQLVCVLAEVRVQQEERSNGRPVYSMAMKSKLSHLHVHSSMVKASNAFLGLESLDPHLLY